VRTATVDSNVWVSAFHFRGKPRQLIELAEAAEAQIHISEHIIAEVLRVLRLKFHWSDEILAEANRQMREIAQLVTPDSTLEVIRDDPADNRILECAHSAGSDCIVTGDNDLLRLGSFGNVPIVTVAEFLATRG